MKTIIAILIAMMFAVPAVAQNTLEIEHYDNGTTSYKLCFNKQIDGQLGLSAFAQVKQGYGQAYAGPSYLSPNFKASYGLGVETSGDNYRYGGYIWAGKGRDSITYLYSGNHSTSWHETEVRHQLTEKWAVSYVESSSIGKGGRTDYALSPTTKIRGTVCTQRDVTTAIGSLKFIY